MSRMHRTVILSQSDAVAALIGDSATPILAREVHGANDPHYMGHLVLAIEGHGTLIAFPYEYIVDSVEVFEPFVELTLRPGSSGEYVEPFTVTVASDTTVYTTV